MFEEQPEFDLVGEAQDAQGVLIMAEEHTPDLVLIDRELPGSPIENLIDRLHALKPKPIVVVMSSESQSSRVILKAGADAFVSKGDEPDWLMERLHKYAKQIMLADAANPD
jgi:DNA-binding NarL/FixJ family response regulator